MSYCHDSDDEYGYSEGRPARRPRSRTAKRTVHSRDTRFSSPSLGRRQQNNNTQSHRDNQVYADNARSRDRGQTNRSTADGLDTAGHDLVDASDGRGWATIPLAAATRSLGVPSFAARHVAALVTAVAVVAFWLGTSSPSPSIDSSPPGHGAAWAADQLAHTQEPHVSVCTTLYALRMMHPDAPHLAPGPLEILGLNKKDAQGAVDTQPALKPCEPWVMDAYKQTSTPYWNRDQALWGLVMASQPGIGAADLAAHGLHVSAAVGLIDGGGSELAVAAPGPKAASVAYLLAVAKSAAMLCDTRARRVYLEKFVPAMQAARGQDGVLRRAQNAFKRPEKLEAEQIEALKAQAKTVHSMCLGVWVALYGEVGEGEE